LRSRRWPREDPLPKRPYRDTALVFGGMAGAIVLAAWLTGGDLGKALVVAAVFFVAATAWSWRRWRERLRAEDARRAKGVESNP
jgi:membrane protein implicated in regulation of membrane protease activity